MQACITSITDNEYGAEYTVCSGPSKHLPKGAVPYDRSFSHKHMAAGHWPNMMRLAFTRGALDLQAVAMLVAADLAKLDLSQSKPSFAIDSDATPWLMKGNWPMLEHLDIQTNKIKVQALQQISA